MQITSTWTQRFVLAADPVDGGIVPGSIDPERTLEFLEKSQAIAFRSYEIWNEIWAEFFKSQLWTGLVIVGLLIAGFSFISAAAQWLPDLSSQNFDGRRAFRMFAPIFAVVILLGNGGALLGNMLLGLREIGTNLVNLPLRLQILDMSLNEAVRNLNIFGALVAWLRQILSRCDGEAARDYEACLQNALVEANAILDIEQGDAVEKARGLLDFLGSLLEIPVGDGGAFTPGAETATLVNGNEIGQLLNPASILLGTSGQGAANEAAIQQFLSAVQVAFVNGLEVVLLGAFALFPIVLALLLTSQGGQALTHWISGIMGLYATQLVYNVITGMICLFLFMKEPQEMTRTDDMTFKVFVSFLAPLISLGLGFGQFSRALNSAISTARFTGKPGKEGIQSLGTSPQLR